MNDMTYMLFYICFFVLMGFAIPLINTEFNSDYNENSMSDVLSEDQGTFLLSAPVILVNMFTIPFWTFGVPAWLNLTLFLVLRLHMLIVLGRNIWIGGGS